MINDALYLALKGSGGGSSGGDFEFVSETDLFKRSSIFTQENFNDILNCDLPVVEISGYNESSPHYCAISSCTSSSKQFKIQGGNPFGATGLSANVYFNVTVTKSTNMISYIEYTVNGQLKSSPEFKILFYKINK